MGTIELVTKERCETFKINCIKCGAKREQKMIETREGHIVCSNCKKKL